MEEVNGKPASQGGSVAPKTGKEPFNPAFDKRLMRRRWSEKEISNIIYSELERNGKLKMKVQEIVRETNGEQA